MNKLFILTIFAVLFSTCNKGTVAPITLTGTWEARNNSGAIVGAVESYMPRIGNIRQFSSNSTYIKLFPFKRDINYSHKILKQNINFADKKFDDICYSKSLSSSFSLLKIDYLNIIKPSPDKMTSVYIKIQN